MLQAAYNKLYHDDEIDDDTFHRFHRVFFEYSENEKASGRLQQVVLSVSFCEPELPLALWRSYGSNGSGVALGFSLEKLKEIGNRDGFSFHKIEYYAESEMLEKYAGFWEAHIDDSDEELMKALNEQYLNGYFIKRKENSYEREWRLIYTGLKMDDYIWTIPLKPRKEDDDQLDYYMTEDDVRIYYKLSLRDDIMINTVCIGPLCKITTNEMNWLLQKNNLKVYGVCVDNTVMR